MEYNSDAIKAIRAKTCKACPHQESMTGRCDLGEGLVCGIQLYFKRLSCLFRVVHSEDIGDYAEFTRNKICSHCPSRHLNGSCLFQKGGKCRLDQYLQDVAMAWKKRERYMPDFVI